MRGKEPPRPIASGDIVAAYSETLGEWTAAQLTRLNFDWKAVGVLALNWSGSEPSSVEDLGHLKPLRLTHHGQGGRLAHCNFEWVLPRSYKVIGNVELLTKEGSNSYAFGWHLGDDLARQRQWDSGDTSEKDPADSKGIVVEDDRELTAGPGPRPDVRSLTIKNVGQLDCALLVEQFPNLTTLWIEGTFGVLTNAERLNDLRLLKRILLADVYGMDDGDCLLPDRVSALESLCLHNIPAVYAAAMRRLWRKELANGTFIEITGARTPEWVAENRTNPLREWDGRHHISKAQFTKSVAQFKATRRAVLEVLASAPADERHAQLVELGRQYGEAFNKLDQRRWFIETEEREDLFAALGAIVEEAGLAPSASEAARHSLWEGVEAVRDW